MIQKIASAELHSIQSTYTLVLSMSCISWRFLRTSAGSVDMWSIKDSRYVTSPRPMIQSTSNSNKKERDTAGISEDANKSDEGRGGIFSFHCCSDLGHTVHRATRRKGTGNRRRPDPFSYRWVGATKSSTIELATESPL